MAKGSNPHSLLGASPLSPQLENGNNGFLPKKAVGGVQCDDAKIWKALKKVNVQEHLSSLSSTVKNSLIKV